MSPYRKSFTENTVSTDWHRDLLEARQAGITNSGLKELVSTAENNTEIQW